jgi:hypothetical protein
VSGHSVGEVGKFPCHVRESIARRRRRRPARHSSDKRAGLTPLLRLLF